MAYHNEFGAMALIAVALLSSLAVAEYNGTINLSYTENTSSAVTGLRGETLATTTTTVASNSSSSSDSGITASNTTTTTVITTTTTSITTTTGLLPYDHYSAGQVRNNFSEYSFNDSIANTPNLSIAVSKYIGNASAIDMPASSQLINEISIIKSLDVYQNRSRLDVRIFFNGTNERKNIMIYDMVPKAFAENASIITVESAYNYTIVENDPTFLFFVPSLKQDEMISINYVVNKKVNSSAINSTAIDVFAGPQTSPVDMWFMGAVIIIIAVIGAVIFMVQNEMISLDFLENLKTKNNYKAQYIKSGKKQSKIEKLLEKVKKAFAKKGGGSPVVFRYEYKR